MSWQAMAWATRAGKDYELAPSARLVLWAMANYADPEGNDIYPSIGTLCDDTGLGDKTIKRMIKHLSDVGILAMGDQRAVDRLPKNRRPTVYRFIFQGRKGGELGGSPWGGHSDPPANSRGVTGSVLGGHLGGHHDPQTYKTKEEPTRARTHEAVQCRECGVARPGHLLAESGLCPDCLPTPMGDVVDIGGGRAAVVAMLAHRRSNRTVP